MSAALKNEHDLVRKNLRLKAELWDAIDASCEVRAGKVSCNTWITEAIQEKLERESKTPTKSLRENGSRHV